MANFELQGPDGKVYEVEAPDQAAAVAAFRKMQESGSRVAVDRASILPFSKNQAGETFFDINSGLLGAIKSGVTLPGDVATGKVSPESDRSIRRMLDLTTLATPVNPAIRAGERAIPGVLKSLKPGQAQVPTAESLLEASQAGYNAVRGMGVDYSADAIKALASNVQRELEANGVREVLSPKTFSFLKELQSPPEGSFASISDLESARRSFGNAAKDFANPTEQMAASEAIRALDEFLAAPPAESVLAGPAAAAGEAIKEARGNYAAAKRSEKITGAEERALDRAGATNSGLNIDNQLRQRIEGIINKPKDARGYTDEELAFMREVVRGKFGTNATRYLGNLLGGGGGLGAILTGILTGTAAGTAGGAPGLGAAVGGALPLAGYLSKRTSAAMVKKQIQALDEMTRKRSPLYGKNQANAPMEPNSPVFPASILRLLGLGVSDQDGAR